MRDQGCFWLCFAAYRLDLRSGQLDLSCGTTSSSASAKVSIDEKVTANDDEQRFDVENDDDVRDAIVQICQ